MMMTVLMVAVVTSQIGKLRSMQRWEIVNHYVFWVTILFKGEVFYVMPVEEKELDTFEIDRYIWWNALNPKNLISYLQVDNIQQD